MELFIEQFPIVIHSLNIGFIQTLKLFFVTLLGAIPLGLLIAFGSMSRFRPVSYLMKIIVWIIRGTPLMIQLLIIYYFPEEAGLVLGMTKSQIFFRVTLLQMIKRIVPPMSNEIITLVKDTSLARIIALQEIIWAGQSFMKGSQGISGAIWPLFFTAVYYLIFNGILTVLLGRLEKKLDYFR